MILNTPSIISVNAFDPSYPYIFLISYSGSQVFSNRAVITDNVTQEIVYDNRQDGLKLNHILPANTLKSGKSYVIQIQVFDNNENYSNMSSGVLFHCYETPQFYFSNVNENDVVSTANFELQLRYHQEDGELLNEYRYYVYDMSKELIYTSESFYSEENMNHTIYGLKNHYIYYIRAVGETTHHMQLDTGMVPINVKYEKFESNIAFEAVNDPKTGCIIFKTNIVSIGYTLENENYSIENGVLTLTDNTLTYETGTDGDFSLIVKAKKIPIGTFLYTTDNTIAVSVENICGNYYCRLLVNTPCGPYSIFKPITIAHLTDSSGKYLVTQDNDHITVADKSTYNTETMIVFEIYRINNMYDIFASYI